MRRLQEPRPLADDAQAVLERENRRHARRGILAVAIADNRHRFDAKRLPELGSRVLGREQHQRRPERVATCRLIVPGRPQHRRERPTGSIRPDQPVTAIDGVPIDARGVVELPSHAGIRLIRAGKPEDYFSGLTRRGGSVVQCRMRAAAGEGAECVDRRFRGIGHDREALREVRPPDASGMRDVAKCQVWPVRHGLRVACGELRQGGRTACRQRQAMQRPRFGAGDVVVLSRRLLDHNVRVGAAETE